MKQQLLKLEQQIKATNDPRQVFDLKAEAVRICDSLMLSGKSRPNYIRQKFSAIAIMLYGIGKVDVHTNNAISLMYGQRFPIDTIAHDYLSDYDDAIDQAEKLVRQQQTRDLQEQLEQADQPEEIIEVINETSKVSTFEAIGLLCYGVGRYDGLTTNSAQDNESISFTELVYDKVTD